MNRKIIVITLFLTILITMTLADITYSYLINLTEGKVNKLYKGNLTTMIYENGAQAPDYTNNLIPTENTATKYLQVKNIPNPREIDAYVRVMLLPVFRNESGTLASNVSLNPVGNTILIISPNGSSVTLNLNPHWYDYWIYSNGYYYYKEILHPNELTPALLQNITVPDSTLWNTFQIEVLVDSIQTEGNAALNIWEPSIAAQLEKP